MKKRAVVYIDEKEYKELKSKLALLGKSVSGWFREVVKKMIKEGE